MTHLSRNWNNAMHDSKATRRVFVYLSLSLLKPLLGVFGPNQYLFISLSFARGTPSDVGLLKTGFRTKLLRSRQHRPIDDGMKCLLKLGLIHQHNKRSSGDDVAPNMYTRCFLRYPRRSTGISHPPRPSAVATAAVAGCESFNMSIMLLLHVM